MLAPDLTDPHIAALLQGVRELSLDPGVVEPEPEVNPAASESSSSESESVSVVSADNLDRGSWRASWLLLRYADPIETPKFGGSRRTWRELLDISMRCRSWKRGQRASGKAIKKKAEEKGKRENRTRRSRRRRPPCESC